MVIGGKNRFGIWIERHPLLIIAAAVLLTAASIHYAQFIEMQGMQTENFVGKDSDLYQKYDHLFMEKFGTQSLMVIIEGDDVTTPSVLKAMDRLIQRMEEAPSVLGVDGISQIVARAEENASGIRGIPDDQASIDRYLEDHGPALSFILPDKRHTIVAIETPLTLTEREGEVLLQETEKVAEIASFPPGIEVIVTGDAALGLAIKTEMATSNGILMGLAGLLMILALLLVFRHVNWPILPLPTVFLGIIWTFGIMGLAHIPMTMISVSAFPILIGIGIDYAIQFHSRIEEEFSRGGTMLDAVVQTVSHTAPAVLIALLITAAGFFSLFSSTVPMIQQFGLLCLIGLIMCYLSGLFVEISLLYLAERRRSLRDPQRRSERDEEGGQDETANSSFVGEMVNRAVQISLKRQRAILVLALVLSLAGTYADTQVPVDTDFKNYIPQDLPPLVEFRHLNDIFGGSDEINIVVQGADMTDPKAMRWVDEFGSYLKSSRQQIYDTTSIATMVRAANGGFIPETPAGIKEVLDSLPPAQRDKYIDGHDTALIDLNIGQAVRDLGEEGIDRLLVEVKKDGIWFGPHPGMSITITGDLVVMTTVIDALTTGRTEMTLIGLLLIFLILLAVYRDLIKALVPVLPMMVVIGWMGGVMYVAGMSYTPLTATLGALILGVGSEYSILMMERFYEELDRLGDEGLAIAATSKSIGAALMASGLTTVFGFAALMASPFLITSNFGILTVLAVIFALATTFTVFPVLLLGMEKERTRIQQLGQKVLVTAREIKMAACRRQQATLASQRGGRAVR
ncbi:MAG: bifunctional preprotein translocase subunit SecD/SecF [Methanosaeta sp. PtaB.Bin039]|nr:MAG: bifunctional preprotein translocase subunit SecD/SecF [Methanosaeta sp. PtaB.Bin039]OPY47109.1 MAG: bifunctional preprotein translocase subunit SecD/SecF [Methanosaeta sp. PtaU1.Bin028]